MRNLKGLLFNPAVLILSIFLLTQGCGYVDVSVKDPDGFLDLGSIGWLKTQESEAVVGKNPMQRTLVNGYYVETAVGSKFKDPIFKTGNGYQVFVGVSGKILSENEKK